MNIINIKNMVCPRCIDSVRDILIEQNIAYNSIKLGEVKLVKKINQDQIPSLADRLHDKGFELLDDNETSLVNSIKTYLIELIHYKHHERRRNMSEELASHLGKDYSYLSKLFSKLEGITIEQYMMQLKIEKVKELISYDEMSMSEIAFELDYSSGAHLSSQFRKITGMSPSEFKKLSTKTRKTLDDI